MLKSITTLKNTAKLLNFFFNKNFFMMTKNIYLYDRFFVSNRNFTVEHAKIQGFTRFFFFKISQISGIFRSFMPKLSNSRICGNPIFSIYKYLSKIKSFVKNKKMTCRF